MKLWAMFNIHLLVWWILVKQFMTKEQDIHKGVPGEVAMKRNQVQGFVTEVRRPLARLLRQVSGDFYADRLKPIHDACDRVEAQYDR